MFKGDKLIAKVPLSWRKSFRMGVVIPQKMRKGNKSTINLSCGGCDKLLNQSKDFSASLKELKRQPPNEFGHLVPKYIIT